MNYRHIYHAGNFADVMKHLTLCIVLDYLMKKEAPLCVVDAHGGLGIYNLQSEQAEKTGEWRAGIGCFEGDNPGNEDFDLYFNLVKDDLRQGFYPGSPFLIARMLRPQDRFVANELHPDDYETLKYNLRGQTNTAVTNLDAYECIRGQIPPREKRGLILIDPPFEKKDEFAALGKQMTEWKKRFPTGVFLLWYPIKAHLPVDDMLKAAAGLGLPRTWNFETLIRPRYSTESFNGSGLVLFNAPYQVPERIDALLPLLRGRMALTETVSSWLTQP